MIETKTWTSSRGEVRHYVQNLPEFLGMEIARYGGGRGNIRWATLGERGISNAEATRILAGKVWIDADGVVQVRDWTSREVSSAEVIRVVREAAEASVVR